VGCQQNNKPVYFVKDNGVGFDLALCPGKLFGVFNGCTALRDYERHWCGLGYCAAHCSPRHGGSVWTEAEVNKGATFYFSLEEILRY